MKTAINVPFASDRIDRLSVSRTDLPDSIHVRESTVDNPAIMHNKDCPKAACGMDVWGCAIFLTVKYPTTACATRERIRRSEKRLTDARFSARCSNTTKLTTPTLSTPTNARCTNS